MSIGKHDVESQTTIGRQERGNMMAKIVQGGCYCKTLSAFMGQ